jgi:hypothetical protein
MTTCIRASLAMTAGKPYPAWTLQDSPKALKHHAANGHAE